MPYFVSVGSQRPLLRRSRYDFERLHLCVDSTNYCSFETSISLLVANLSVIIAFIFRLKPDSETENTSPLSITTFGKRGGRPKKANLFSTIGLESQDLTTIENTKSTIGIHIDQSTRIDFSGATDTKTVGKTTQASDSVYQLKSFGSSTVCIPHKK